jgi:hypothetical protein
MAGTATSPVGPVDAPSGRLRTAVGAARIAGAAVETRRDSVLTSAGRPRPHDEVQAEAHDHDDGQNEEFHGRSLLARGVLTANHGQPPPRYVLLTYS